jgi:hypothetical protein
MPAEDLKSRVPGPLDAASRAFVDRVGSRGRRDQSTDEGDPGSEIDDTALPLDNGDPLGTVEASVNDTQGREGDQPDRDNPNDLGEDTTPAPLV